MDTEEKAERDEGESLPDEVRKASAVIPSPNAGSASVTGLDPEASSREGREQEENGPSKRRLSGTPNATDAAWENPDNVCSLKRMKRDVTVPAEAGEGDALQFSQTKTTGATPGSPMGEADSLLGGTAEKTAEKSQSDGNTGLPESPTSHGDPVTLNNTAPQSPSEKELSQDVACQVPECATSFRLEKEISVSCTVGSLDRVFKCRVCDQPFPSCADLEKHTQSHAHLVKENAGPQPSHKAENSPSLCAAVGPTHGSRKTLFCHLCGFQCGDDKLLQTHCLGKTHLRRQNLAARGGFVHILAKRPFPKKPQAAGPEMPRGAESGAIKPRARSADPEALRRGGRTPRALKESHSEQGEGSRPFVETRLSRSPTSEKVEKAKVEKALSLPGRRDGEGPGNRSDDLGTPGGHSEHPSQVPCAERSAHTSQRLEGSGPERTIPLLPAGFRQRRTLALRSHMKKRLNLLGITSRRCRNETPRMFAKLNFRMQKKPVTRSLTSTKGFEINNDLTIQCAKTILEAQELGQEQASANPLDSTRMDSLPLMPGCDPQGLCVGSTCDSAVENRKEEGELQGDGCHPGEMQSPSQMGDSSCVSTEGLEKHLQGPQHGAEGSSFHCQHCSFVASGEISLQKHLKEDHTLTFACGPCHLSFLSNEDLADHEKTEPHVTSLAAQPVASQPANSDLAPQTVTPTTLVPNTIPQSPVEEMVTLVENDSPEPLRVNHGEDTKHSTLNKPLFQCKKCFYKTRSSMVLMRHRKLRHAQDHHFLCKACNLYSLSKEGMEKHIKRSKHLENAKKNNIGLRFEDCIERVWIGASDSKKAEERNGPGDGAAGGNGAGEAFREPAILAERTPTQEDLLPTSAVSQDNEFTLTNAPRRGRPRGNVSRSCPHCGLLASSITNLTVHIRRKHSHQYSYLCSVCNYYTVTKGDMERHCTTKKHRGRVATETSGKQSPGIVVGPAGGNLEAGGTNSASPGALSNDHAGSTSKSVESGLSTAEKPPVDPGGLAEAEAGTVLCSSGQEGFEPLVADEEPVPTEAEVAAQGADPGLHSSVACLSDNKCLHCEFVAHSSASLELHVKRKHTKEFEYYCMACDYYAVTRREMTRHAATEKHKMKRQCHLCPDSREEADSPGIPSDPPASPEEVSHKQESKPLKNVSVLTDRAVGGQGPNPQDGLNLRGCPVPEADLEAPTSTVIRAPVAVEPKVESNPREECSFWVRSRLRSQLSPLPSDAEKPEDSAPAKWDSPQRQEDENAGEPGFPHEPRRGNSRSEGSQRLLAGPGLENKPALPDSRHEAEDAVSSNIWGATEGVQEGSEVFETVISIDDRGRTLYSLGQFDSSIVRVKSHQEEPLDPADGSLTSTGAQTNEVPLKDPAPSGKKKKSEGHFIGKSIRIPCDDCGFLADGLSGLNVHIAMKHPSKEKHFHCLLCGKSFYTESNLHQHLASAGHLRNEQASVEELPEGGATFKCVKCTEPFDSEQSLFLHIKEQHEELLREVNKYIVEDTQQINRERKENKGNVCKYCGKMCRSSNSMAFLAHIRTHTGSKPFKCKICHFATAQLGDARNHVKRHLGMREYKCHVCGVAFVMKKHLNTHLLGKHGVGTPKERKFTCLLCDRSFTEKWALNNHTKLHTGEKPFKCTWPTCHYSFLTASAMKDHYRTHTGEKSFLCDLCGFAGGTRHALTKHRRQHTGEKPFKCDECNFASTTQSHLTRHKRVHTGEKPYRCPWCDYRSNCAENIRKHILHTGKHEGVKMYNCPQCDYGTNVPVEFRNHLKEQHPDIENPDLAYLHAGIVSKSYECRLKGQGATFVETERPFTAAAPAEESPVRERPSPGGRRHPAEPVQQVIIIHGYDGDLAVDASVEETAAATLQTLALAGQVARVVHITEDGRVFAAGQNGPQLSAGLPHQVLTEQLPDGATRVVVLEGPEEGLEDEVTPLGAGLERATGQGSPGPSEAGPAPQDAPSALDALLCAVTELGTTVGPGGEALPGSAPKDLILQVPGQEAADEPGSPHLPPFPGAQELEPGAVPVDVPTQLGPLPALPTVTLDRSHVAFKKMVQGVLQLAMCGPEAADQLMKDGVTQFIVNEEGTVHMVASDGAQIIMQGPVPDALGLPAEHLDLMGSGREISQIIVTEELAQAMAHESAGGFAEGTTHYIVTELPQVPGDGEGASTAAVYSHTVIEAAESPDSLSTAAAPTGEQLTSMVIYTQGSPQEQ
ncbi:zinc finger protein 407 [Tachyglossus aculeatus]|uniref:zinc finger protein 407 n=1 Tax=Tachyglossus aculeatus TaxID=9261 RepID=UPI0018F49F29|nr:zinc finger protein 407 [Tachyglossus aculeatus]